MGLCVWRSEIPASRKIKVSPSYALCDLQPANIKPISSNDITEIKDRINVTDMTLNHCRRSLYLVDVCMRVRTYILQSIDCIWKGRNEYRAFHRTVTTQLRMKRVISRRWMWTIPQTIPLSRDIRCRYTGFASGRKRENWRWQSEILVWM